MNLNSRDAAKYLVPVFMVLPVYVWAEPGASLSHLPYLWTISALVSGLLSWVVVYYIGRAGKLQTTVGKRIMLLVFFVVFLMFLSPLIVALGSIMISGRTM